MGYLQGQDLQIRGRLFSSNSRLPPGSSVQLIDARERIRSVTPTEKGEYQFENLYPGAYIIRVMKISQPLWSQSLDLQKNLIHFDIDIDAVPTAQIEVKSSLYIPSFVSLGKFQGLMVDLPQSIGVVTSGVIQETAAVGLEQALVNISGIVPSSSSNYGFFDNQLIRGLGAAYTREGLNDGPTFMGYRRSLADVEQIEVLKGPGSALFGSAGPGGTINLTMKKPKRDSSVIGQFSIGSFNSQRLTIDATGPLTNNWAYRIIGHLTQSDGFRKLSSDTREWTVSALWQPTDAKSLLLTMENRDLSLIRLEFHSMSVPTATLRVLILFTIRLFCVLTLISLWYLRWPLAKTMSSDSL